MYKCKELKLKIRPFWSLLKNLEWRDSTKVKSLPGIWLKAVQSWFEFRIAYGSLSNTRSDSWLALGKESLWTPRNVARAPPHPYQELSLLFILLQFWESNPSLTHSRHLCQWTQMSIMRPSPGLGFAFWKRSTCCMSSLSHYNICEVKMWLKLTGKGSIVSQLNWQEIFCVCENWTMNTSWKKWLADLWKYSKCAVSEIWDDQRVILFLFSSLINIY